MAKLEKLSASMIRDYQSCPRLFYYRYILKLKLPEKPLPLTTGSAVHDGIETFFKTKDRALANETVRSVFKEAKIDDLNLIEETVSLANVAFDEMEKGNVKLTQCEKYFTHYIPELGIKLNGRLDGLEDLGVLEFKTATRKYKQEDVDKRVQGTVYSFAYKFLFNKLPSRIRFAVLLKNAKRQRIQYIDTYRTEEQHNELIVMMKDIIEKVEKDQFDRASENHPVYCDCYKYESLLL